MDLKCKNCSRFLGKSYGSVVAEIKCPSCKMLNQFKRVSSDRMDDIKFKFKHPEIVPVKESKEPEVTA